MDNIINDFFLPFFNEPKLFIVPILLSVLSYYLAKKLKTDELLFNSRKEYFGEFMKEYGANFYPNELNIDISNKEVNWSKIKYERRQKICNTFSQCRLVSSDLLERKLRHLFTLLSEEDDDSLNKEMSKLKTLERVIVGLEVEALMRKGLHSIGYISLWVRLMDCFIQKIKIKF